MGTPSWMGKDAMSEDKLQKGAWISWGKVGDGFRGILIGREWEEKPATKDKPARKEEKFELFMFGGEFHTMDDDKNPIEPGVVIRENTKYFMGSSLATIPKGMRNIRLGDEIVAYFEEKVPSTTKGNSPTKVIKFFLQCHHADWMVKTGTAGVAEGDAAKAPNIMDKKFGKPEANKSEEELADGAPFKS